MPQFLCKCRTLALLCSCLDVLRTTPWGIWVSRWLTHQQCVAHFLPLSQTFCQHLLSTPCAPHSVPGARENIIIKANRFAPSQSFCQNLMPSMGSLDLGFPRPAPSPRRLLRIFSSSPHFFTSISAEGGGAGLGSVSPPSQRCRSSGWDAQWQRSSWAGLGDRQRLAIWHEL